MNEKMIKQARLSDGSEIICELIEEYEQEIIVRVPLKIVKIDLSYEKSIYTFKPYMTYTEFTDNFIALNWDHVIAIANPHKEILKQYVSAIKKINKLKDEGDTPYSTEEEAIKKVFNKVKDNMDFSNIPGEEMDSASSNVIYVPFSTDKDKMH